VANSHLHLYIAQVLRTFLHDPGDVQKTPKIKLSMGDESFSGTVRFLTDRAEHERVMTAIRQKYWMFRPVMELGRVLSAIGLMRDNAGSFEVTLLG
jgi:hypothetical protein